MNKMIFVAALLLTACSPNQSQDEAGNLQNTIQIDSTPDNSVGFTDNSENDNVVDEDSDGSAFDNADTVDSDLGGNLQPDGTVVHANWKDAYKDCTDNLADTSTNRAACETTANRASGISKDDETKIALLATHEKDIDRTVFKPCMQKTNNYEKCSALTAMAMNTTQ